MSLEQYDRVLDVADERARRYLAGVADRPVAEQASVGELRKSLDRKLPQGGEDPAKVVEELADAAEPGLIALGSPRYFGFVIGGTLPATLGAEWLAGAWDQTASLYACGPSAAVAEEVSGRWVLEALGLPTKAGFGLTTGGRMANFSGIAAGRHAVLARAGWDVEARGLNGAPALRVLVGEHAHATIYVALRLLGLGSENAVRVRADDAGRMDPEALAEELDRGAGPAIVCAQAGEVNTGCFDPFPALAEICERHGAWLHVDGAVGLWAASSREFDSLTDGLELADSWSTDAHKWLNVPYDCGYIAVKDADHLRGAMGISAQRGRHQPGSDRSGRRRVRRPHGGCGPADPAGRDLLARGDPVARTPGDPHLGLQLADDRGRHPPLRRRHPERGARGLGRLMPESGTRAVLFDIDGTLISTGGASDRAWKRAFKELQDVAVDVPAVTGKGVPDPEVGRVVFERAIGRAPTDEEADALMRRRLDHLPEEVQNSPGYVVKEGVDELLEQLIRDGVMIGLTTGNVEEAARVKLARANLNRFFSFGGFGSDSPDRTDLTKIAVERGEFVSGHTLDRARSFSCGDTPRDVEAGHGAGLRVVGVATGEYTTEELIEAGADVAIHSLVEGLPLL